MASFVSAQQHPDSRSRHFVGSTAGSQGAHAQPTQAGGQGSDTTSQGGNEGLGQEDQAQHSIGPDL
eukprot:3775795-Amphidinium_carterae.3